MKFNYRYLSVFIVLLAVEVYIAMFIHDNIVRPFIGDVLVVCVIYFFLRSFTKKRKYLAVYVFIFACLTEVSQYYNLVSILHLENIRVAKIILGSTFDLNDILCYFIGTVLLCIFERIEVKIL